MKLYLNIARGKVAVRRYPLKHCIGIFEGLPYKFILNNVHCVIDIAEHVGLIERTEESWHLGPLGHEMYFRGMATMFPFSMYGDYAEDQSAYEP